MPSPPLVSRPTAPREEPPLPTSAGDDAPLRRVGGRAIRASDLGDFVLRYMPEVARGALDQLLDEALVEEEARRESVTVSDAALTRALVEYLDARRRGVRVEYGDGASLERVVEERFGRSFEQFRDDARRAVRVAELRSRLVRLDEFREDAVEVRIVVLSGPDAAVAAAASLRAGADMTLLAERAGIARPSAPPPVFRGETGEPALEERLFAASAGDVLEPVPFGAEGGATYWQVFKVVRTWKRSDAPWTSLADRVEESLRAAPATDASHARWRMRALARHPAERR